MPIPAHGHSLGTEPSFLGRHKGDGILFQRNTYGTRTNAGIVSSPSLELGRPLFSREPTSIEAGGRSRPAFWQSWDYQNSGFYRELIGVEFSFGRLHEDRRVRPETQQALLAPSPQSAGRSGQVRKFPARQRGADSQCRWSKG